MGILIKDMTVSQLSITSMVFALENCHWSMVLEMKNGDAVILMKVHADSDLQAFLYIKLRWDVAKARLLSHGTLKI